MAFAMPQLLMFMLYLLSGIRAQYDPAWATMTQEECLKRIEEFAQSEMEGIRAMEEWLQAQNLDDFASDSWQYAQLCMHKRMQQCRTECKIPDPPKVCIPEIKRVASVTFECLKNATNEDKCVMPSDHMKEMMSMKQQSSTITIMKARSDQMNGTKMSDMVEMMICKDDCMIKSAEECTKDCRSSTGDNEMMLNDAGMVCKAVKHFMMAKAACCIRTANAQKYFIESAMKKMSKYSDQ